MAVPRTYAPTITTIIARGYVTREKKRLYPTELGRMVTSVMTEYLRARSWILEFTAQMEEKLDERGRGQDGMEADAARLLSAL